MTCTPEIQYVRVTTCDPLFAILASDGLFDELTSEQAIALAHKTRKNADANVAAALVQKAVQKAADNEEEQDNTTALFVPICTTKDIE